MYNLSIETSGHYVVENLHNTINFPDDSRMIQEFRLSYYDSKTNDVISTTFYVGLLTPYTYSLDTNVWYQTMEDMVANMAIISTMNEGILSPLRSRLSLKMLSGDMLEIDLDYGNVDYSPHQQINIFLREIGIISGPFMRMKTFDDLLDIEVPRHILYSIFDENGVKNLETDVIHDGQEMNIFIH